MYIKKLTYKYLKPEYNETFKVITYPGIKKDKYMISTYGRVYNIKLHKFMTTYYDKDDYEKITLVTNIKSQTKRGNKSKHYLIHRLMAWEFLGPPPDEYHNVVNHKNGIPCCNLIDNLEWTSVLGNTIHAKKMGLLKNSGLDSYNCKYNEKIIRKICLLFENGFNNVEIFEIMTGNNNYKKDPKSNGLYCLINKLGKRIIYRDIVSEYDYVPNITYFKCNDEVKKIRNLIYNNKTNIEILNEFGYKNYSDNKSFYNKIIYERSKCDVLFNDYRKDNYNRNIIMNNQVE